MRNLLYSDALHNYGGGDALAWDLRAIIFDL